MYLGIWDGYLNSERTANVSWSYDFHFLPIFLPYVKYNNYIYLVQIAKTYRYKLSPNNSQIERINSWIGACRVVYNIALETKVYAWKTNHVPVSRYDLQKQLVGLKEDFEWIKDVQSQVLQCVLLKLDLAYQSFFRKGGFPKWAKKGKYTSLQFPQGVKILNGFKVQLPKLGVISIHKDRLPNGKIKQAILKKEIDGYYISISVEEQIPDSKPCKNQAVGIDMGVAHFASLSNGKQIANPKILQQYERLLRIEQRSLARKKKGSANWKKQKEKLAKLHLKIKRVRYDFLQKQSTQIVGDFSIIAVEDLKLKNMTKSSKGKIEEPGSMVKQKSGLNRVLLDVAIGEFFRQLEYKSQWYRKTFVKVDPKNTSRECNNCGYASKDNRKKQNTFDCIECGYKENADIHASKNILARAIANVPKRKAVA